MNTASVPTGTGFFMTTLPAPVPPPVPPAAPPPSVISDSLPEGASGFGRGVSPTVSPPTSVPIFPVSVSGVPGWGCVGESGSGSSAVSDPADGPLSHSDAVPSDGEVSAAGACPSDSPYVFSSGNGNGLASVQEGRKRVTMIAMMNMETVRLILPHCRCCRHLLDIRFLLSFLHPVGIMSFPLSVDVAVPAALFGRKTGVVNDGYMVSAFPVIIIS